MPLHSQYIEQLKALVAESAMCDMTKASDFMSLHRQILQRTDCTVSVSTLKRFFGYIDGYSGVHETTLNTLSRFVGYSDWHTFVADYCGVEDNQTSHRVLSTSLPVSQLAEDDRVAIEWNPNRRLVLRHLGQGLFEVVEAHNSKMIVGDRFRCNSFTIGHPLYVSDYLHADNPPTPFVAGKKGGLTKIDVLPC